MNVAVRVVKETYERDGFVVVRSLIAPEEAAALLNDYLRAVRGEIVVPTWREYLAARQGIDVTSLERDPRGENLFMQLARPSRSAALAHWQGHPCYQRATRLANELCPVPVGALSYDQCFFKPAGSAAIVYPHQDAAYWRTIGITCWVALTEVGRDMAPVEYYPNTGQGLLPHIHAPKAWNGVRDFTVAPDLLKAVAPRPVTFVLEPGDCVFHSSLLVHGSGPNTSERARCGLALHFKGTAEVS